MIKIIKKVVLLFTISPLCLFADETQITLSKSIYNKVAFSSQFSEDGALIRNVKFSPVDNLRKQLEKKFNISLESRGEAHITTLTPPEAQGWFTDKKGVNYLISTAEIQSKYSKSLQNTKFEVDCIDRKTDGAGKTVFYIVVKAPDLFEVRKEIQNEVERRAEFTNKETFFQSGSYYPHITIGYIGGDVHTGTKGPKTCIIKNEEIIFSK